MTTRTRVGLAAAVAFVAALVIVFEGELQVLVANRRPHEEAARLVQQLGVSDGEAVAEIGSGRGALTVAMAAALPRSRVYSTELDPERLADVRRAVARASLGNVEVREAGVEATNLPDGCCAAIFMRTVYHHFSAPRAMLESLHRSLAPGGRLGIIEFEPRGIWRWFAAPDETPDRGGHGVPIDALRCEVTGTDRFRHLRTVERWAGSLYLMVFARNQG